MSHDPRSSFSFAGSFLILIAVACVSAPRLLQNSQEPAPGSSATAGSPQEPAAQEAVQFQTKLPERPNVKLVYAHEAGEKKSAISFEERQRRELVYMIGNSYLNLVTLEALLDQEAARRSAAKERVGGEAVTDESVEALIQQQVDIFKAQAPNGDFYRMRLVEGFAPEHYQRTVKLVLRVVDMFFPRDPANWPMQQLEGIFKKGTDNSSWDAIEQDWNGYKDLLAQGKPTPERPDDFTLSYMMLPGIFGWLRADAKIETPDTGLPEGVAMRVNGRDFMTATLIEELRPLINDVAEEGASNLVGLLDAIENDLRAQKKWLSRATLDQFWEAERAGYEGTIFTHDQTVMEFLGFPSMEVYRQFFNARQCYRSSLPTPIPQSMFDVEIAARGSFIGLGEVDTDVILIGAVDKGALEIMTSPRLYKPGSDPFAAAGVRAQEVAQQLKDGETFDSLLLGYSDFPPRTAGSNNALQRDRGRFSSLTRADLRVLLGESDFSDFVNGYSIGDDLFFTAEKDAIYGPTQGPLGWYLYRMTRRTPPATPIDPADPRVAYQLEEDLVTQNFLAYVNGLR